MASRSANSDYPDHNPSTKPASQPVQGAVNEDQATVDASKESSPKSVFVNSQPIREEQVQNAVKFLSDPRVRGSLLVHRRHFLEGKGLTKEEIDEAFQRVPDPSPAVVSGQNSTYQDAQSAPVTNIQTQSQEHLMQPMTASPSVVMPTTPRRFQWSYAVLAAGFLTIVGAGTAILFKNAIIPGFKSSIRRVALDEEDALKMKTIQKPNLAEEVAAAAKTAAAAATDVAKASQEMLITKIEEKRRFVDFRILLSEQLQEIRMLRNAITRLEGQSYSDGRHFVRKEYRSDHVARSMQQISGISEFDARSVRSLSPPASAEPSHSKSNMKIMAMAQRGEVPPYIRDIDDLVTNNKPISNPILVPRTKPRDAGQITSYSSFVPQSQVTSNGVTSQSNDSSAWQQTYARIAETNNRNVPKTGSASNGMGSIDNRTQRRWVPPQPPPVSLPEAAAAIRQPKSIPKNVDLRSEDTTKPVSELDELPRITNISESGGQLVMNGASASSQVNPSEIQEEKVA